MLRPAGEACRDRKRAQPRSPGCRNRRFQGTRPRDVWRHIRKDGRYRARWEEFWGIHGIFFCSNNWARRGEVLLGALCVRVGDCGSPSQFRGTNALSSKTHTRSNWSGGSFFYCWAAALLENRFGTRLVRHETKGQSSRAICFRDSGRAKQGCYARCGVGGGVSSKNRQGSRLCTRGLCW